MSGHEHQGSSGGGIQIGRSKSRPLFVVLIVIGRGGRVGASAAAGTAQLHIRAIDCRKLDETKTSDESRLVAK